MLMRRERLGISNLEDDSPWLLCAASDRCHCSASSVLNRAGLSRLAAALICLVAVHAQLTPAMVLAQDSASVREVRVVVDSRVELMSIIFRLAGHPEYNQGRLEGYVEDVEDRFGPHRDHPVVALARQLRSSNGVSYDACMSMAIHLPEIDKLKNGVRLDPRPERLDQRWPVGQTEEFIKLTGDFVEESNFLSFIENYQPLYDISVERMEELLNKRGHLEWFNAFFGERPGAEFTVALGMLNGPQCYGPSIKIDADTEELYCVLGVWESDRRSQPKFDRSMLGTIIHEFCHSYVNRIVDEHEAQFKDAAEQIYPLVESAMQRQAYGTWQIMMKESLVRACVVRYTMAHESKRKVKALIQEEEERQFLWMGELTNLLDEYETQRDKYKTMDAFAPRLIGFFNDYAPKFVKQQQRQQSKSPQVVSITPANGATDVSAKLKEIVIEFDRPMRDGAWSVVGGGPNFPKIKGQPSYDAAKKVLTLRVKLKPNWTYTFGLNSNRFKNFASAEGVPLKPVTVTFSTAPN